MLESGMTPSCSLPDSAGQEKRRRFSFGIVLIMLLAIGLRVWGLQVQSFTMDETTELGIARTSIGQIILKKDGFPPLYHILLRGWLQVFHSDEAARWLSVLFGGLSILTLWKMTSWLGDARARIWTAFLVAISPFHIWYSQESRAYALYFLEAALALWFFFRAIETDRPRDWILYGLACLAGVYTHYCFPLLIIVNGLVLLIEKRTWNTLKYALLTHAGMGILSLPILWLLRIDMGYPTIYPTPFNVAALGYTYFTFLAGYSIGPSMRELRVLSPSQAIVRFLPWVLVVGFGVLVLGREGLRGRWDRIRWRRLAIVALVPVVLCGFLLAMLNVGFKVQYVLWASIPLFILLGTGLSKGIHRWPIRVSLMALCLVFAVSLYNRHFVERYMTEDTRKLGAYLASQPNREAPVLVTSYYMARPVRHDLGEGWVVHPLPSVKRRGEGLKRALKVLKDTVPDGSDFWLVYTRAFYGDPGGRLKDALLKDGMIQWETGFAGIELYRGKSDKMIKTL